MKNLILLCLTLTTLSISFNSCSKKGDGNDINIFPVSKDIELGKQLVAYLESDTSDIIVLEPSSYPTAYSHINRITNAILNSGEVKYKDRFEWRVRIIHDDETLNAFCAPGGYIYVYTGIIKYLDNEYELAGVMGHEIAHADKRHSTNQMTTQFGISLLLAVIGGDQSALGQIGAGLLLLKYGRAYEEEADEWSVRYLCPTDYQADGAAQFFRKISGRPSPPEFLSTHPNPENRVEDIESLAAELACEGDETLGMYAQLKASLPN